MQKADKIRAAALADIINPVDPTQARRIRKLTGDSLDITIEGIQRHYHFCNKSGVNPDASAIREIIDDALLGKRVFDSTEDDESEPGSSYRRTSLIN